VAARAGPRGGGFGPPTDRGVAAGGGGRARTRGPAGAGWDAPSLSGGDAQPRRPAERGAAVRQTGRLVGTARTGGGRRGGGRRAVGRQAGDGQWRGAAGGSWSVAGEGMSGGGSSGGGGGGCSGDGGSGGGCGGDGGGGGGCGGGGGGGDAHRGVSAHPETAHTTEPRAARATQFRHP